MKIICTQENLKLGLNRASRIITSSGTLPILNNILLKTNNGVLRIISTNLEISINTLVRCKVEEDGEICVPAKMFLDLVSSFPNKNISISKLSDSSEVLLNSEGYSAKLKIVSSEDFPAIPDIDDPEPVLISSEKLLNAFSKVVFACSTNETQPEISGVYFSINGNNIVVVATDRYRLAEQSIINNDFYSNKNTSFIIPRKSVSEILKSLNNTPENTVNILINENQVIFSTAETSIITRLVDGQYPDYKNIVPHDFSTTISCNKNELVSASRASGVFSYLSNSVKLSFSASSGNLIVSSGSQEFGEGTISVPASISGLDGVIVFNYKYIQDMLSVQGGDEVKLLVNNDSSPALITTQDPSYFYMVMPINN